MAQEITITVEDSKVMAALRKTLSTMQGVTVSKPKKKKMSGIEEAREDVRCGRVTTYESVDAFFKEMGTTI